MATRQGLHTKSFALAAEGYSEAVGGAMSDESVRLLTEGWGAACAVKRETEAARVSAPAQRGERPGASRLAAIDPISQQANLSSDGAKLLIRGEGWKEVKLTAISAVSVQPAGQRQSAHDPASRRASDPWVRLTRHSYQAGLWDVDAFARQQYAEGVRRGLEQCAPLSSVNDGAEWIERTTRENFPAAIQVLDWSHVEERLGLVAQAALVQDSIVYFQNQHERMHYDQYRAAALPIGSGTVESAATTLVHLRLKRPGRGWCRDNAQSMLAALSELNSGRFDLTWRATSPSPC